MQISFGTWAFLFGPYARRPLSFEDAASRIAEAGYDGIEICGFPPQITLNQYPTAESQTALSRRIKDLGLGISGYAPDFTMVNPLMERNRNRYLDLFSRYVELCVHIESPAVRVDTIAAPGSLVDSEYADFADRLASLWRDAAEIAARAGVRMVWEFEPGFVFNKPSEVVDIYEQVGHSNFHILFDTCHAYLCGLVGARQQEPKEMLSGGLEEFLNLLSGRIGHIHVIDTDGSLYGDETSTHSPFGEGVIDFGRLAPKLLALPGIDWWCVDLSFRPDCEKLLKPSLAYLRKLTA